PAPITAPASVQGLKLHLRSVTNPVNDALTAPLRAALVAALIESGFHLSADMASSDALLDLSVETKDGAAYFTSLRLTADGKKVETVDLNGGAIGNKLSGSGYQEWIANSIAPHLAAKLAASPKVAEFALEPRKVGTTTSAPHPSGGLDRDEMKRLMLETLREASEATKPAVAPPSPASSVDAPRSKLAENPDNFALVIGVEKYSNELPDAQFAERDAQSMKAHLLALGYPERNIKMLQGSRAVRSSLEAYLEDWLPKNVQENGTVFVYFSGHGAPDPESGQAYLVPWDGDPAYLSRTAYPLKRLYASLNALKAKRVLVALDSCFSGAGGRSVLQKGTRPLVNKVDLGAAADLGKLVVFTASGGNQISGTFDSQRHGLFTYYFLTGLGGAAADAQGRVTAQGLHDYLSPKVADEANRANRTQSPQILSGAGGTEVRLR
ncbi:MAG: caspase family protein, partial [Elusimicrobia bacterium]|nr:caspase family protein [Elusimicrobiota bacterium]